MQEEKKTLRVGIVGGGPTAMLLFKKLLEYGNHDISVTIYERKKLLGAGMPYSRDGALDEHITNVSGNEIPELCQSVAEWISSEHPDTLHRFGLGLTHFNDYKVLPRLLFGRYLADQFAEMIKVAKVKGIKVVVNYGHEVTDIIDDPEGAKTCIVHKNGRECFDKVIICSGHHWPKTHEDSIPGYYDSPYPPEKLAHRTDHPVAVRGSSLTAIDAIRTLARANGKFEKDDCGNISYLLDEESRNFKMVVHSRSGLLPAVRFHLEDSHLSKDSVLSKEEIHKVMQQNEGFLPLDYVFKRNFLEPLEKADAEFHSQIKDLSIEMFVERMMGQRHEYAAFELLKLEMQEAERSISKRKSVDWKEMLAVLSFAMNYPAKHFSAEDMMRLKKHLMPLISVVIAFAPQGSVNELMALGQAGVLNIITVSANADVSIDDKNRIIYTDSSETGKEFNTEYKTFVDAIGQPHLEMKDVPYPSLISMGTISHAMLCFRDQKAALQAYEKGDRNVIRYADGKFYQSVSGIAINDYFQVVDRYGAANNRIYMLAVPYIEGYNPDFSGLDFGEAASERVANAIFPSTSQTSTNAA